MLRLTLPFEPALAGWCHLSRMQDLFKGRMPTATSTSGSCCAAARVGTWGIIRRARGALPVIWVMQWWTWSVCFKELRLGLVQQPAMDLQQSLVQL
jgi:hypothetical protein